MLRNIKQLCALEEALVGDIFVFAIVDVFGGALASKDHITRVPAKLVAPRVVI